MILGFSTKFPKGKGKLSGKLTLFPDKILQSLINVVEFYYYDYSCGELPIGFNSSQDELPEIEEIKPKHHTIRRDLKNRWKVGMIIDFFIGVRTKSMYRFAPTTEVKSIQKVEIKEMIMTRSSHSYSIKCKYENINEYYYRIFQVKIDDRVLKKEEIKTLAINDGFDSAEDFFKWFNENWTGKLIHWTNLKY